LHQARTAACPTDVPHKALTWQLARAVLQRDAERDWQIESNVSRLRLQTIDSLCASLTRQMPVLSRFGAQPEPIEDASLLYREAARATLAVLESRQANDAATSEDAATLLMHLDCDSERVIDLLVDMLARRDQWLPALRHTDDRQALQAVFAQAQQEGLMQVDQALRAVDPGLPERLLSLARFAAGNLQPALTGRGLSGRGDGAQPPLLAWLDVQHWPGHTPADLPQWLGLVQMLLTEKDAWRRPNGITKRIGFPAAGTAPDAALAALFQERKAALAGILEQLRNGSAPTQALLSSLAAVRGLPPAQYSDTQWHVLGAIVRLACRAAAELRLAFARHGQADFTEVAQQAIVALGDADDPSELALRLDYRIRHLLVDEFQDTSYTQFALLQRLTAGWEADAEGALGRSLFLVGDPMQSIYRFRQAEVGLFLRARAYGLGDLRLHPLRLSVNFRSTPGIVDWVNLSFEQLMPQQEDIRAGAVSYAPSVSAQALDAGSEAGRSTPAVQIDLLRLPADDTVADTAAPGAREAQRLLQHVQSALARDPGGSIAILVRARTHVRAIAQALRRAAIAYRAIEIETLNHQPVVQDLYALTRALAHPADRLAWLSVLRAPWCGLTLADLHALVGNDQRSTVTELLLQPERVLTLSQDGQVRVARLMRALQPLLASSARGSLRQQVESAWLALAGPACSEDASDLADAAVYLDFLEAAELRGEAEDLDALGERLAKLYAQPEPEPGARSARSAAAPTRVQIMTIHKAKGLEFDTVIVPGLARGSAQDRVPLLQWLHRPAAQPQQDSELLLAPIDGSGSAADPHVGKTSRYVQAQEKRCQQHEEVRLLYVAATRARSRLHWLAEMKPDRNGEYQPGRGSLLATLWPVCQGALTQASTDTALPQEALQRQDARAAIDQRLRRLPSHWQMPPLADALQWQASATQDEQAAAEGGKEHAMVVADRTAGVEGDALASLPIEFSWAGETARHVGIVAHAWLQRMAQDALQGWNAARVAALQTALQRELLASGVAIAECAQAVRRVQQVLQAALEDQRGLWLLGAKPWARNEWRVRYCPDGPVISGSGIAGPQAAAATFVMDRVFLDEDGVLWIVDYKTSTHDGANLQGFLDQEQQRYRDQLERYARILRQLRLPLPGPQGTPIVDTSQPMLRLGLYFPQLRGWRSWTPETG
jgi:ATP-dependent exoDNAse (exonuclease V) beta subunit